MDARVTTKDMITNAADELFYQRGFDHTSFADISEAVKISRGNIYHHFKTKDEILEEVINLRTLRTLELLKSYDKQGDGPLERVLSFTRILLANRAKIKFYGCPVGSLCAELAKLHHPSEQAANQIYVLFRDWLSKHLREYLQEFGLDERAEELSLQILAWSQGTAMIYNAFHDDDFLKREVDRVAEWLGGIAQIGEI